MAGSLPMMLAQFRQPLAQRHFEEHFAVEKEHVEGEEDHRRIAQQRLRNLAPSEPLLDRGERQDAIAEGDDLAVEDDARARACARRLPAPESDA